MGESIESISQARNGSKVWLHVEKRPHVSLTAIAPPVSIEIQMTMACNLRCKWCSYWIRNRFDTGSMSSMPLDIVVKLASYCSKAGVRGVYFSGGGEPLAYIHIAAATEAFHDAGCELALITNGTLLRRRLLELMNRFTYIQVSLIGTSDGTYVANTGRHGFSEMSALPRAIRERHGSDSPTVSAGTHRDQRLQLS